MDDRLRRGFAAWVLALGTLLVASAAVAEGPAARQEAVNQCFALRRSEPAAAVQLAESILAETPLDVATEIKTLSCLGVAAGMAGDAARARDTAQRIVELTEHAGLPSAFQLRAYSNAGAIFHNSGEIARAEALYERAYDLARAEDEKAAQTVTLVNLAIIHADYLADLQGADAYYREALALAGASASADSLLLHNYAENLLRLGHVEEGRAALERADRSAIAEGNKLLQLRIAARRTHFLFPLQGADEPLRRLRAILEAQQALPDAGGEATTGALISDIEREAGNTEAAVAHAARAVERAQGAASRRELLEGLSALAAAQAAAGRGGEALATLTRRHELEISGLREYQVGRLAMLQARLQDAASGRELEQLRHQQELAALAAERARLQRRWEVGLLLLVVLAVAAAMRYQRRVNRKLRELSSHDTLTGLSNRRAAAAALAAPIPGDAPPWRCLLLIDVDHFKQINDRFGHDGGDRVLRAVADRLSQACAANGLLARWGGEEFLVIAPCAELDEACALAERLRAAVENAPALSEAHEPIPITVSIGFAAYAAAPTDRAAASSPWSGALKLADRALYQAKHSGRNAWVGFWAPELGPGLLGSVLKNPESAAREGRITIASSAPGD